MFQKITVLIVFFCFFFSVSVFGQRYLAEVFSEIQVDTDIVYGQNVSLLSIPSTGNPEIIDLLMDIYTPVGDTETNRPFVLYLHAGHYLPPYTNQSCLGTRQDNAAVEICTRLAKMGYVVASIDYRLGWSPLAADIEVRQSTLLNANYRGMQDTRTCLRYFRKTQAEEGNPWGIDPGRAVVWGDGVGGSIALSAATVHSYTELLGASICFDANGLPYIDEAVNGDIYGTSLGLGSLGTFDTLSIPNHIGYSSDFNLSVNTSGYLIADEWLNAGDIPMISFQGINDILYPYGEDVLIIPTSADIIIPAHGSLIIQQLANGYGNNQVFVEANIEDEFTNAANELNNGLEGLFPFILDNQLETPPLNLITMPWNWVDSIPDNIPMGFPYYNCNLDEGLAQSKIDTIIGYFAPRAFAALCFGCQEFKATVFLDENANGIFDGNDTPLNNVIAEFQPDDLHANSNQNGEISKLLTEGNYTLTITPPLYHEVTATPYPIEFSITPAGISVNNVPISIVPIPGINDLTVSLLPLDAPKPGFENFMKIKYKNQGTTTQAGTITLNFSDDYTLLESMPIGNINANQVIWETGDLASQETGEILLEFHLPSIIPLGEVLLSEVSIESTATDETPTDNFDPIQQIVIGSFDPNDKAVNPKELPFGFAQDRYLTYLIRFQNTGTAPAVNIRVEDTLSQLLNINTLEMLDASHAYRMEITGDQNIAWHFDDIFLPDSTNNEPESHGHLAFRIKMDLPSDLPSSIDNQAFIYFDFNEAILTNIATTEFLTVGVKDESAVLKIQVQLFPNPVTTTLNIECDWPVVSNILQMELLDIYGKIIQTKQIVANIQKIQTVILMENLPMGIYQIRLSDGQFSTIERVVKVGN